MAATALMEPEPEPEPEAEDGGEDGMPVRRVIKPVVREFKRIKVLSMGDGSVGKSCLIKRFCEQRVRQPTHSTALPVTTLTLARYLFSRTYSSYRSTLPQSVWILASAPLTLTILR